MTTRCPILLAALLAVSALAPAPTVRSGVEAWGRGDYPTAVAAWRPLAAKGDPDAMFNLGQAYRLGRGVPIDLAQAMDWYVRAANLGHVDAETQLGILLFQNGNRLSGLKWLGQAAEKGDARAELLYGTALFNGDGMLRRDPETAYRLVASAAAKGLAPAKTTLSEMDKSIPADVRQRALSGPAAGHASTGPSSAAARTTATKHAETSGAPPATSVNTAGGWRVQLGAFGQRASAEALFRRLSAGTLGGKQAYFLPVGAVTRLQVGPYASKAAAESACAALSGRGQACFAVPAR